MEQEVFFSMIIGMRGHDFGRMEPRALALAIREARV